MNKVGYITVLALLSLIVRVANGTMLPASVFCDDINAAGVSLNQGVANHALSYFLPTILGEEEEETVDHYGLHQSSTKMSNMLVVHNVAKLASNVCISSHILFEADTSPPYQV